MKFGRVHGQLVAFVLGFSLIFVFTTGAQLSFQNPTDAHIAMQRGMSVAQRPLAQQGLVSMAAGGCSRFHLPYNQIDTISLTGLSSESLFLMPSSFWRYEDGSIRVTFAKTSKPCKGASCEVPQPGSDSEMATAVEISSNRTTNQSVLLNPPFVIDGTLRATQVSQYCLQYHSQIGSNLLRPPNLCGAIA